MVTGRDSYTSAGGSVSCYNHSERWRGGVLKTLKVGLLYGWAIPLLGIYGF